MCATPAPAPAATALQCVIREAPASEGTFAAFDRDALRVMKETAVFDKPFVKKSALIRAESLPQQFYEDMKNFARRELPIFASREEALAWLVEA
jgi:hypothetical protein